MSQLLCYLQIGARTYGPDASDEKAAKQDASYAGTKKPFGFSVLGMSVYHGAAKEQFMVMSKDYGKGLNKDNIEDFIRKYLDTGNVSVNSKTLLDIVTDKLLAIQAMYSQQKVFHIFGSSILFVYDAAALMADGLAKEDLEKAVVVKMIDFAHVHPAKEQPDENYNNGLKNLLDLLVNFNI